MTDTTQFHTVDVDADGFDQLAQGLTGFSDEAQDLLRMQMMTTIFITGASAQSDGRFSYILVKMAHDCGCRTPCAAG